VRIIPIDGETAEVHVDKEAAPIYESYDPATGHTNYAEVVDIDQLEDALHEARAVGKKLEAAAAKAAKAAEEAEAEAAEPELAPAAPAPITVGAKAAEKAAAKAEAAAEREAKKAADEAEREASGNPNAGRDEGPPAREEYVATKVTKEA